VLIENKSQDLYGGLIGWPFRDAGPLRLISAHDVTNEAVCG
jgi:hypothetical protein